MPKYDYHVFVCVHRRDPSDPRGCCSAKGSDLLLDYFKGKAKERIPDGKVRVQWTGCLDACARGPSVVVYPEGVWYTVRSRGDIDAIIEEHLIGRRPVERLLMAEPPPEQAE
jgi:(2Fe-2S) ferredoxin